MESYIIPTKPMSYKEAAQKGNSSQENAIIEPTYTEIEWETQMKTMREEIIK